MPQIGLGVWQASIGEAKEAVAEALKCGYRLIDTAAAYMNEEDVGAAIAEGGIPREELFITTKLWNRDHANGNYRAALETSLKKLGLDHIDLYLIHWPLPSFDNYVAAWKELEQLRDEGLIRSIGVSNFEPEHLERLAHETTTVPAVNQIELHPGFNQEELRTYCDEHGIVIESWSPIGGQVGSLLSDPKLAKIASVHSKTPAQIVIRWHLQLGFVVIPKSVRAEHIRENFDVFDFELSDEEMATVSDLEGERQGPNPHTMDKH